jgi:hypothetical protein
MAMQLIKAFSEIFSAKRLPLWLRPYLSITPHTHTHTHTHTPHTLIAHV